MRVVVDVDHDDVVVLRQRVYRHVKPRPEFLDLANRLARALGLPETDDDPTYPDLRPE